MLQYLKGLYNTNKDFLPLDLNSKTRGHSLKLKKPSVKTTMRQHYFSVRVVNAWNSLPEEVVSAPSLNAFKNRLDKAWAGYKFCSTSEWYYAPTPATSVIGQCENSEDEETSTNDRETTG